MTHTEKSGIEFKYLIVNERDRKFGLWVNTVGYQSIPPQCAYPLRDHPSGYFFNAEKGRVLQEYQLVYIVRGRGTFASGSAAEQEVGEGQLILLFPGLWHTYSPLPKTGWTEYYIGFEGETIDRLAGESFLTEKQQVLDIGINEELTSLFIRALAVAEADKTAAQQYLAGIVLHMVGLIQSASKNRVFETGNIDARIEQAKIIMNAHVEQNLDPEELASTLNISYSWFRHVFKQFTGYSPAAYFQELKLRRAKELLVETSQSAKEISFRLGFQSTGYFFSFFKKHTGLTPLEYRSFGRGER